jgi:hypothetical protein
LSPASSPPSSSAAASGSGVFAVVDPSLLAVLPATVGGDAVFEYPDAEQQAARDADLGRNIARIATAFVGDPTGANWAYTAVVDVRPEARTEAFYRDWQTTFDASACERAGGVTGHTSVEIGGRSVERTACGGGVRTYHVRLEGTGILISVSDLGDKGLGQLELAALRP